VVLGRRRGPLRLGPGHAARACARRALVCLLGVALLVEARDELLNDLQLILRYQVRDAVGGNKAVDERRGVLGIGCVREERGRGEIARRNVQRRSFVTLLYCKYIEGTRTCRACTNLDSDGVNQGAAAELRYFDNKLETTLLVTVAKRIMFGTAAVPSGRKDAVKNGRRSTVVYADEPEAHSNHGRME
jgi:hypothetical protein